MISIEQFASDATDLHARLTRVVLAMCGDRALAEDSAQEALLRAWERVNTGEDLRSLDAWTIRVALNWCRSQLRRSGAEDRAVQKIADTSLPQSSGAATETGLQSELLGEDVQRAVLCLPDRQREVIVLHYLLDMDVASIAAVVDRSSGAVKNALFNGRAALARELGANLNEQEVSS
ncbi:MAG TPA: RNA polymerase sigma factor [Microthrixaceae bacterium]|nr:RNA polymerase sigma factor [Microthrixaceae bacterium]